MKKAVIVLGMGRSATSLVARSLAQEIYMGPQLKTQSQPDNVRGQYESQTFKQLNEEILQAAGGSWHHPPPEEAIVAAEPLFRDRIAQTIEAASAGREVFGWKDPRTTLTVRLYTPHLEDPIFVTVWRSPERIVESLHKAAGEGSLGKVYLADLVRTYHDRLRLFLDDVRNGTWRLS